jgi:hypothetical protein
VSSKRLFVQFEGWLLHELKMPQGPHAAAHKTHPWWQVMCLTGVDYFSTLGYQPGIAFLAASYLSPIATLVLVAVTLFAAYPVYAQVARQSPDGQGSISMLERLLPGWGGKLLVLVLLGFAATDFIITMTLSAADATAHVMENPFMPSWMHHQVGLTLALIAILAAIFLKGFGEAIGVAVLLVGTYLVLNLVVIAVGLAAIFRHPESINNWTEHLFETHGSPWVMLAVALILFPKLALGLSGFETGVAVMPQVAGGKPESLQGRIRNTRKLLLTAAVIMSCFLILSSLVTSLLIPAGEFRKGGEANGRALAYIAHKFLGEQLGTVYDLSTIAILGFAGASAMAGLLNLVPRYLPRYGMAPEWARASRPMVLVFTTIAFAVTLIFNADVDAQGGAYATGVLVLMSSAAIAVTLSFWRSVRRWLYLTITLVFIYTTVLNIIERPEGIKIAGFFIFLTVGMSLLSRGLRATELRITRVSWDTDAQDIVRGDTDQIIRIVAHRPGMDAVADYDRKDRETRELHNLSPEEQIIFLEITPTDASTFDAPLEVRGVTVGGHHILRAASPAVPNAIAALLLDILKITGRLPHAYFGWTEGNPIGYIFRFLFLGEGDVAPITREVLRKTVANPARRPIIHVS